jgi:uncharacterized protein YbjT (DUF2867 family)
MTILVTGATGSVGRLVVAGLCEAGRRVRAMTRRPEAAAFPDGVEVVAGDLTEPSTLREPLHGVEALYLFPEASTAREVVALAKESGVRRIVVLSSGAVTGGLDTEFHLPVEEAVRDSGVEWTFVRPGEFALNKLWLWGPSIRAEGVVRDPFPEVGWYPTHEADIAEVALAALLEEGHAGRAYTFDGPELVSHREQVRAIAEALDRDIAFEVVSPERAREIYRAQGGFAADNADMLLGFTDYSGHHEADPHQREQEVAALLADVSEHHTCEQATGRPARTFAQWARDHAADFR